MKRAHSSWGNSHFGRILSLALLFAFASGVVVSAAAPARPTKVIAERGVIDGIAGVAVWHDYGTFALYRVTEDALARIPQAVRARIAVVDDTVQFDAAPFNPLQGKPILPPGFSARPSGSSLSLVQFVGPIKDEWLSAVSATGARTVHYVNSNAYLVWGNDSARAGLADLAAAGELVQFSGAFEPWMKVSPTLRDRLIGKTREYDPNEIVPVVVQMLRHADKAETEEFLAQIAKETLAKWSPVLDYQNLVIKVRMDAIQAIANRGDVTWVGERLPREKFDEVQDMVLVEGGNPSGPGYLTFLAGLGFPQTPASYPIVDVTDDGLGADGTTATLDRTFHELGVIGNATRVAIVSNCTGAADGRNVDGHGHLNTNIVGGYDDTAGYPWRDPNGFQRALGVSPYTRLASTRIFAPGFSQVNCGNTDQGLILRNWQNGSKISSNSWGCSGCAASYDDSSQAFDTGTRDADAGTAGNQELLFVFAAGNSGSGAGTVGTPGNGKSMITVGASENVRMSDESGSWTDGCAVGPTGADNSMDVIGFSSRGPSPGNRKKPDVIAPGTHIHGTASTAAGYTGNSVCDQFRPTTPAQTLIAASSGTSHSTPAVSGVASLVWNWINEGNVTILPALLGGAPPTPAGMKAYIIAHPTYLTGVSANDTLPSNNQGYGMPNLTNLFDSVPKVMLDQSNTFDNTGETYTFDGAVADNTKPVRIVLVWTDKAGAIGTSPQVNNLNLTADVGGSSYTGNVFTGQWSTVGGGAADTLNNVEAIFVQPGASGAIQFIVSAANIADDGVPGSGDATDQDFAVVCYNCAQEPTFTEAVTPSSIEICTPNDAVYTVNIGSVLGFSDPVTLSASGHPAGTTATFATNPVTPVGSTTLTIGNTGSAAAGPYTINVMGVSGVESASRNVGLTVFTGTPGTATLVSPTDDAIDQPVNVSLNWNAVTGGGGGTYTVEVATDAAFTNIVSSATGLTAPTFSPAGLITNTEYFWRVRTVNTCGTGSDSVTWSFITIPAPGDCTFGVTPLVLTTFNFEAGASGFTTTGSTGASTWAIASDMSHSPPNSFKAIDIATVSDQRLISPAMVLPSVNLSDNITLHFWNRQDLESRTAVQCWDGGLIEISTDNGTTWTQLVSPRQLTDPYDGPVQSGFSNPLVGLNAWCGDPQDWLNSIIDINSFAGLSVRFRFRLGTDSSIGQPGWWIDDVKVQYCPQAGLIFNDGFESGDTSAWSLASP